jgi:endonuclease G
MNIFSKTVLSLLFLSNFIFAQTGNSGKDSLRLFKIELPEVKPGEEIIHHLGYSYLYNEKHEQAYWVAYELTAAETEKAVERSNDFFPDKAVKTGTADNPDYSGSGYDRGHLAPAADMSWSEQAMNESFLFGNISPQLPAFNRGIWKKLEELVRTWAVQNNAIYVVTGPILEDSLKTIGPNKVSVPKYYYKVILDYEGDDKKAIGFVLPNLSSIEPLKSYAMTVDSVEKLTGINFFSALPKKDQKTIESTICIECWSWEKSKKIETHHSKKVNSEQSVQCKGITTKGKRCQKNTQNENGYCNLHEKQVD